MVWAPEAHFERHMPLALLTGFLGSGKTTLLNRILADPRLSDTAVAINEFGDVGLDQHFVPARAEDVIVLANGCMCCFASSDLEQSLAKIFQQSRAGELPPFRRLIIETSGMADPEFVLQAVLDSPILSRFLWLDSIVTTVDGIFGAGQIAQHPEAAKQVRLADRLVVTKGDLAAPARVSRLRGELRDLNPGAAQLQVSDADFDVARLFSPTFFDEQPERSLVGAWVGRQAPAPRSAPHAHEHEHEHGNGNGHGPDHSSGVTSTTLTADAPVDWRRFQLWLGREQRRLGERLLRVKGIVRAAETADPVVIHAVQSVMHVPVSLTAWPEGEQRTRIVFIHRSAGSAELESSWRNFVEADEIMTQ